VKVAGTALSMCVEGHSAFRPKLFEVLRTVGNDVSPHDMEKDAFYVPGNSVFIKLGSKMDSDEVIHDLSVDTHKIHSHGYDAYTWFGPALEKYAKAHDFATHDRNEIETIWALIQTGADKETVEKIAGMKADEVLVINRKLRNVPLLSKVANDVNEVHDVGLYTSGYWTKLAAWMPTEDSVDAVLSLNFLNKKTLNEFVALIPQLEQTAHELSRMLLAVRMGLRDVDEEPLVEATQALSKILYMLHGAKNVRRVNG
jgi:hypothetical protein